jgi:hypothetical protein
MYRLRSVDTIAVKLRELTENDGGGVLPEINLLELGFYILNVWFESRIRKTTLLKI